MVERTLLALLGLHVVEETVGPGASLKSFAGFAEARGDEGRCPICLEFVEIGEEGYRLTTMDRDDHHFHRACLDAYMESQVRSHGRSSTNNLILERPGRGTG